MKQSNHTSTVVLHRFIEWAKCILLLAFALCEPGAAQPVPPTTAPIKIVLLSNGEMLEGRVVADSERLFVFPAAGGQINLPRRNVARLCDDASGAYRFLAAQVSPGDTDARVRLVEWCLTHNRFAEAQIELDKLRQISKRKNEIDALARRLAMRLQSQQAGNAATVNSPQPPARRNLSRPSHISPEALTEFTRHIQPLLINGCAAAACHGRATTTEFVLTRPPRGYHSSQRLTQRNLSATLQQLDMVSPGSSALLKMAHTPHGGTKAVYGTNAVPAFKTIADWVESVAGPIEPTIEPMKTLVTDGQPDVPRIANTASTLARTVSPRVIIEEESELPPMDLLPQQLDKPDDTAHGRDPFDAEVFNAMFGT